MSYVNDDYRTITISESRCYCCQRNYRQSRFWTVYCMLVGAALLVIYTVVFSSAFRPIHILDLMLTVLAFAGLVSYSFQRRVGWRPLWQAHAFVFPAWELVFNFVLTTNSSTSGFVTAVLMACFVPEYWALWQYGFHSPDIWNET